ncbi:FecR family protein [Phenylobacterium sp.]|uniref:FecR family protein n=1 Tax=Phenylobacterium sp. TaxID=1871053 RepID=UPI001983B38E|nr:FecR family protein [Phenylobacterium sp.]MBC7168201.1 FecR domain-containing protein [Phenylobacterium sp.]
MRLNLLASATALASTLLLSGAAFAADWRLVEVQGRVRLAAPGKAATDAASGVVVPEGANLTTAGGARAVLTNGDQRVVLGPNSRMTVASDDGSGVTRMMQDLGSVLFQVDKKGKPHFRVDTPLLAAVVKGTTFTVAVGPTGDSVHVAEGLVEVRANSSGQASDIPAGVTGRVARDAPGQVGVTRPDPAPSPVAAAESLPALDYSQASDGLLTGPGPVAAVAQPGGAQGPSQSFGNAQVTAEPAVGGTAGGPGGAAVAGGELTAMNAARGSVAVLAQAGQQNPPTPGAGDGNPGGPPVGPGDSDGPPASPGNGNGGGPPANPGNGHGSPASPGNGNGGGPPANPGGGNGDGPPANPGNGNGHGPPASPGNENGGGPPADPGNGNGDGPPASPGNGNGHGPPANPGNGNGGGPPANPGNGNGDGPPANPGNGNGDGPPASPGNGNGDGPPANPGNGNGGGPPANPGNGNGGGPPASPGDGAGPPESPGQGNGKGGGQRP